MEKQGITDGPSPPKPTPRPPAPTPTPTPPPSADLKAEQAAALHQLTAQYDAAVKGGERLAFKDWLNQEAIKFLDEHPKAPPNEKGLQSEGIGPIGLLLYGWGVWTAGLVKASIEKIGEEAVIWIIDKATEVEPSFEPPPSPTPPSGPDAGVPVSEGDGGSNDGGVAVAAGDSGGDGGGAGGGCFTAGTLVATRDGLRAIEAIETDDFVVSQDEDIEATSLQPVLRIWVHEARPTVLLSLATGEVIRTTAAHRFFVSGRGFVAVSHLEAGDCIRTRTNTAVRIARIEAGADARTVYNLSVANTRTYFVGETQAWVHNVKVEGGPDEGGEESAAAVARPAPSGVAASKTTQVPPNAPKPNAAKPSR